MGQMNNTCTFTLCARWLVKLISGYLWGSILTEQDFFGVKISFCSKRTKILKTKKTTNPCMYAMRQFTKFWSPAKFIVPLALLF
jgi:hypothetical protein